MATINSLVSQISRCAPMVSLAACVALLLAACAPAAAPGKPADAPSAAPRPVGAKPSTPEELARYLEPDRQQLLEEGARKEGSLQFYTSGILTSATGEVIKNFEAKYPFVKVDVYRANNDDIDRRTIQEYGAGQYLVDVFETTSEGLLPLQTRSILGSYNSPELAPFMEEAKVPGPNGVTWVVVRESYHGIGWNTNMVRQEDVPKTHDAILDPRWRGMFAVPDNFDNTIGAYLQTKGPEFVNKLKDLKIRYMKVSARQLADLVISGEVPISLDLASAHVTDSRAKGAPVAWLPLEPVPTNDGAVAIAAKPPHPHAALLYLEFVLSTAGIQSYDKFGYGVTRRDIESKHSLPPTMKRFYPSRAPNFEQSQEDWKRLLLEIATQ